MNKSVNIYSIAAWFILSLLIFLYVLGYYGGVVNERLVIIPMQGHLTRKGLGVNDTLRKQESILEKNKTAENGSSKVCSQEFRKNYAQQMCAKYNYTGGEQIKTEFLLDTINKVAYCYVQKAACTTIKTIMASVHVTHIPKYIHFKINSKKFIEYGLSVKVYTAREVHLYLKEYTKFIVVRNPLNRFLSAYYDKILPRKKYRARLLGAKPSERLKPLTLGEFSTLVLDSRNWSFVHNKHWDNFFKRSNPCYIDYDYILKVETLDKDLENVFPVVYPDQDPQKYKNVHKNDRRPEISDNSLNVGISSKLGEFKGVNKTLVDRLIFKYQMEAMFWGYSFDSGHSVSVCGYPGTDCC